MKNKWRLIDGDILNQDNKSVVTYSDYEGYFIEEDTLEFIVKAANFYFKNRPKNRKKPTK